MATVTVDSTSQRYTSSVAQEPDILLLHTTEGMGWPGYNGGGSAPHDTVRAIRGVGIEVRRHYPYDQFSKSLENDSGGVETNKRGVIQVELKGTCDPKYRGNPDWYYWPDADDAVLEALADYYRPIMAQYGIPARAMAEFVAYPKSYGATSTRLTYTEWMNGSGICGHQHAPENAHGDPGNFPIDRFIQFLQEDDMPSAAEIADAVWAKQLAKPGNTATQSAGAQLGGAHIYAYRASGSVAALETTVKAVVAAVAAIPAGTNVTPEMLEAALRKVLGSVDGV